MNRTISNYTSKLTVKTNRTSPTRTSSASTRASSNQSRASRAGRSAAKPKSKCRTPLTEIEQLREENMSLRDQVENQERIIDDLKFKCQRHEAQNNQLMAEIEELTKKLSVHEDF